jgi:hypothetical protein
MKQYYFVVLLFLTGLAGCDSSSSIPPGVSSSGGGPPSSGPSVSVPPGGIQAGKLIAVPPESWGDPNSFGGNKSWKITNDAGDVFVSIFNPSVPSDRQVQRFQRMIDPASAVSIDTVAVAGTTVTRVKGKGTRLTFSDDEMTEVARQLPGEAIICAVFGQGKADLAIMVDGKAEAVEAFGPELESWIKSFK